MNFFQKEHKLSKIEITGFILFSFLFVFLFSDMVVFSPLKYLYTSLHESMHVVATLLTGGMVTSYVINDDFSGHITRGGGNGVIISTAGYVGSAVVSGLLIKYSLNNKKSAIVLTCVLISIIVISVVYTETLFSTGFLISLIISVVLLFFVFKTTLDSHIAIFLGTFFTFQSLDDIKLYLFRGVQNGEYLQTDAYLLSTRLFKTEAFTLPVGAFFAILSVSIWLYFMRSLYKKL